MLVLNLLNSSNINQIRYDKDTKDLYVEFHSGGVYKYLDVPYEVFQVISNSESIGKAFHSLIKKGGYEFEKIGDNLDTMNV